MCYNKLDQWLLYTDASDIGRGAVLYIGEKKVEDTTRLRKKSDRRHINVAELQAIQDGLELVTEYVKALQLKTEQQVLIKCDNTTAVSWINQSNEKKWKSIKGLSAKLVEKILHQIADLCRLYSIKIKVEYIESENNPADKLTRIPSYMKLNLENESENIFEDVVMMTNVIIEAVRNRDSYGRVTLTDDELKSFLSKTHEHEGSKALYERVRLLISNPKLRQECQSFVKNCAICQMAKVNTTASPILKDDTHIKLSPTRPFEVMHMDVLGPFNNEDGFDRMFVITLICRLTRFAITLPLFNCPTADDAIRAFGKVRAHFHVIPDDLIVDEGTQFRHLFSRAPELQGTRITYTSVKASFSNGRVERLHRVINERIRAKELTGGALENMNQFSTIVNRATMLHNTQMHTQTGCTPHSMIFTFQSWIYPELKEFRPLEKVDYSPINAREIIDDEHPIARKAILPDEGEIWLWKLPSTKKREAPFVPCKIIQKLSTQTYRIRVRNGRLKQVHIRHLKRITKEAAENIPDEFKIPEDSRPLRDLKSSRRRGGHVTA